MFEGLKKTVCLAVLLSSLFGVAFAAKVAPLYFAGILGRLDEIQAMGL